jgi:putative ABC transport system ATP-binding protein
MVTHEADVAAYAQRTIGFLDGHVASDVSTSPRAVAS